MPQSPVPFQNHIRRAQQPALISRRTIIIAIVILVAFLALAIALRGFLAAANPFLQAASSIVTILGLLLFVLALIEYRARDEQRRFDASRDRAAMSIDLMARFYDDSELGDMRTFLRDQTGYERPPSLRPGYVSLRDDEVRVLNYFEAVAIAYQQGVLDIALINQMLGSPMTEAASHPTMKSLIEGPVFSYETFSQVLLPDLLRYRGQDKSHERT